MWGGKRRRRRAFTSPTSQSRSPAPATHLPSLLFTSPVLVHASSVRPSLLHTPPPPVPFHILGYQLSSPPPSAVPLLPLLLSPACPAAAMVRPFPFLATLLTALALAFFIIAAATAHWSLHLPTLHSIRLHPTSTTSDCAPPLHLSVPLRWAVSLVDAAVRLISYQANVQVYEGPYNTCWRQHDTGIEGHLQPPLTTTPPFRRCPSPPLPSPSSTSCCCWCCRVPPRQQRLHLRLQ